MTDRFQFPQRLETAAPLGPATGIIESKPLAYPCGQFASVTEGVTLKQPANGCYVRRRRQRLFDEVLCMHGATMHDTGLNVQSIFMGKGQR